jgi:hypothetical protein
MAVHCLYFQKFHCFANESHYIIAFALKLFFINVVEIVAQETIAKPQLSITIIHGFLRSSN